MELQGWCWLGAYVIPENPNELEALKKILENLSIAYIFPDGTGTINENNLKMGKGIWA